MPGKLVHFELPVQDVNRAKDFWGGVFGWSFNDPGMPGMEYWMTRTGDDQGGAIYHSDEGKKGLIVYFDTDEIDASIAKVRELGGTAEDKSPIPHVGWFAHCSDLEGNNFSLFQADESVSG
jgi:predicted enzyme related to lactoylglutathione lyase